MARCWTSAAAGLLLVAGLGAGAQEEAPEAFEVGDTVEWSELGAKTLDGEALSLEEYEGRIVVLNFFFYG